MNHETLQQLSRQLAVTSGRYAADWLGVVRVIDGISLSPAAATQNVSDGDASSSSGSTTKEREAFLRNSLLWEMASTALLTHQVGADPAAAKLWEILFELLLKYHQLQQPHGETSSSSSSSSSAAEQKLFSASCLESLKLTSKILVPLFDFALSLPLGEKNLRRIFHFLGEFPSDVKEQVMSKKFAAAAEEQSDVNNSNSVDDTSVFFARMAAAVQLSREENSTWPLRLVADHSRSSGGAVKGAGAAAAAGAPGVENQLLFPKSSSAASSASSSAFSTSSTQTYFHRERLRYTEWARVLSRRLENPLGMTNFAHFQNFVGIVVRQMIFELPHCELAHVAAFLVEVLLDERFNSNATGEEASSTNPKQQEKLKKWRQQVFNSLVACATARKIINSSDASSKTSAETFALSEDLISNFPTLSALFELVCAESGHLSPTTGSEQAGLKKSKSSSTSSSGGAAPLFFTRLKATTEALCKSSSSSSSSSTCQTTLAFAWLQNLWKSVIVDKLVSDQEQQQQQQQNDASAPNNASNNFPQIVSAIKDFKKWYRLPGKTATAMQSGDAAFFADWAVGEQLLLRDTVLLPEIFRQASTISPATDPSGAPVVVRAATDLFGSQRAEGPAGTVLERAVDRTASFSAASTSRSQLLLQQQLAADTSANQQSSGGGTATTASSSSLSSAETSTDIPPLGTDIALWSAFSDFTNSQNATVDTCEDIERRRRHCIYGSGVMAITANEDSTRRVASSPNEHYLWQMRQLALGGGLVLPGSTSDVAWTSLLRDLEVARRSAVSETGAAAAAVPPVKNASQTIAGFPSLSEYGANPMRLPLQQLETGIPGSSSAHPQESTTVNAIDEYLFEAEADEDDRTSASNLRKKKASSLSGEQQRKTRHHPFIVPEFFKQQQQPRNGGAVDDDNGGDDDDGNVARSASSRIAWKKMSTLPRNPNPPQPNIDASQVDEVAGPHTLRPMQRFQIDPNTAARLQREKEAERKRSRKILVQSLAEASGVASEEALELLDDLPNFLLQMTRAAIVAQNALQQEELEAELNSDASYRSKPLPASSWVMKKLFVEPQ